ncbi:MAG: cysteine desulfurase [Gemmatimonadota bacterium]|nr:MAG: cysteine desulfurase [Gemmatimonadota bacterium]
MKAPLDVKAIKAEFPILGQEVHGHPLVYLDNAASSQKPRIVLEALVRYYERDHANVHRGIHELSTRATQAYEGARARVARFIGAGAVEEVVFVRGTTEGINLVASAWGPSNLGEGDEILLTVLEHHSNIVPWQLLAQRTGARLKSLDIDDHGRLRLEQLGDLLSERTRLVGVTHVSNALGTVNPVAEIVAAAKRVGATVVVDGAQAAPHLPIDVQALGCDFYAFSGHKMCGPTGIGVLWGRSELLEEMAPYQGGGEMIEIVELERSTYKRAPQKFEAGTPNVADAVGLAVAIDFLEGLGLERIQAHEHDLVSYALERGAQIPGFRDLGPVGDDRAGVLSFELGDIHPHDVAQILDSRGIAVRAGHHCNQPLMQRLGLGATTRASFYLYNDRDDVDALCEGLRAALDFLSGG